MGRRLSVTVGIATIPGREELLRDALTSVDWQTRKPDAVVVELDEKRTGAAATRNRILDRVDTDIIAWLDDDDVLKDCHLRVLMRELEQDPKTDLVYPAPSIRGGLNAKDPTAVTYQGRFPVSPWGVRWCPELESHLRTRGSFIPITHAVRADAVRRAGGFPESRRLPDGRLQGEDERYLIALLDAGARFAHVNRRTWYWNTVRPGTAGLGVGHGARS